ncbi:unnamed protein product, partial [Mesorhabditis spiculigera]
MSHARQLVLLLIAIHVSAGLIPPMFRTIVSEDEASTLIAALGAKPCIRECLKPVLDGANELDEMLPSQALKTMCSAQKETVSCLIKQPLCSGKVVVDVALSGLQQACGSKKPIFKLMEKCLDEKAAPVYASCNDLCMVQSAIGNLTESATVQKLAKLGGNPTAVAREAGPLCESILCALPCLYSGLNDVCPFSGLYTVDVMLIPLDKAIRVAESMGMRDMIKRQLPKECRPFMLRQTLQDLRHGKQIKYY